MKTHIVRGALAGVAGSLASVLVLLLLGEPAIERAIELEEASALAGEAHEEVFSRGTQVLGGALGLVLFGLCAGFVFGVVFAATRHRLGGDADWRRARRLGAAAFVGIVLVPFLKYPPNPPAVGDPDTVSQRTIAYLSLLLLSVLAIVLAAVVHDRLRQAGMDALRAQTLAAVAWLVVIGVAVAVLPAYTSEITIPTDLVWSFRLASLGGQAAFWAVTVTAFGLLSARTATERSQRAAMSAADAEGSATKLA